MFFNEIAFVLHFDPLKTRTIERGLEQFNVSLGITAPHVNSIVTQSSTNAARELMEERKREVNAQRRADPKSRIDRIDESLPPDLLQVVQQTREPAHG